MTCKNATIKRPLKTADWGRKKCVHFPADATRPRLYGWPETKVNEPRSLTFEGLRATVCATADALSGHFQPKSPVTWRFRSLDRLGAHFQNKPVQNRPGARKRAFGVEEPAAQLSGGRAKENDVKKEEVLAKVASGDLSIEEASKMLADEAPKRGTLYCKVSPKGAVSVYGLQRMPVTLYVEQWDRLLGFSEEIKTFLKDHDAELKRKERTP
jgi:hypothetical protein